MDARYSRPRDSMPRSSIHEAGVRTLSSAASSLGFSTKPVTLPESSSCMIPKLRACERVTGTVEMVTSAFAAS